MVDFVCLAVHQPFSTNDLTAGGLPDRLVTKTDPKNWKAAVKVLNTADRNTGLVGSAGARRNNQMAGGKFLDFFNGNLVVAMNFNFNRRVHLTKSLDEVVGKRVVIVDDQDPVKSDQKYKLKYIGRDVKSRSKSA